MAIGHQCYLMRTIHTNFIPGLVVLAHSHRYVWKSPLIVEHSVLVLHLSKRKKVTCFQKFLSNMQNASSLKLIWFIYEVRINCNKEFLGWNHVVLVLTNMLLWTRKHAPFLLKESWLCKITVLWEPATSFFIALHSGGGRGWESIYISDSHLLLCLRM